MADQGWISKNAFQDDALAADTTGRAAMADGFLINDKIASATITASKLAASVLGTMVYGIGKYGTNVYG